MEHSPQPAGAIVFISLAYAPLIGGAERQAQLLLERWARQGDEVWMLTRRVRGCPTEEVIGGVRVFRLWSLWLPVLSWMSFSFSVLLFLIPRHRQIRSIWSVMLNVATLASVLAAQAVRRPAVVKISCSGTGGNLQMMRRSPFGASLAAGLLRACRAIIVLNDETRAELRPYSVPDEKIRRIPNGVDTDVFCPADAKGRQALRQRWELRDGQVAVLFVGRLEAQKNLQNLLRVWPGVYQKCPQAHLLLVGEGPDEAALKRWVREHQLGGSVRFLGRQPDVRGLYQASDLFILPSWFEGISNALLEAMACGLPAVVSRIPGNQEVVDADAGTLINPATPEEWVEPLVQKIQDDVLRKESGKKAREVIQKRFAIENVLAAYRSLSESLSQEASGEAAARRTMGR